MKDKTELYKHALKRRLKRATTNTKSLLEPITSKLKIFFFKNYSGLKPLYLYYKYKQQENKQKLAKKHNVKFDSFTVHNTVSKSISSRFFRIILRHPLVTFFSLIFIFGVTAFYILFIKDLPNPKNIGKVNFEQSTQIFDRNGTSLFQIFGDENRVPVKLVELPNYVPNAFIAIEDKDFRKHIGVSFTSGLLRAVWNNIRHKSDSGPQGGSTITQQLVKRSLLSSEKTYSRKIKEMILALWTERIFSKDQILELYINEVAFGGSSYGIEQASKTYFNKHAKDLTIAEAALLAGLPQAPSTYSPFYNLDLALKRRNDVLLAMLNQKYISKSDYDLAVYSQPVISENKIDIKAPHFVFYVKDILEKEYGPDVVENGGLKVITTLDLPIQDKAQTIVKKEIESLHNRTVTNGAALVTRPATGEILAMVGSTDYFATGSGSFNVTTAMRQPGSTFKAINYAVGIERGLITPATPLQDAPICFSQASGKPYCPLNYDRSWHGLVTIRQALANSYNIPAVKVNALNGAANLVASSSAFLISTLQDPSRYGLSLTLGGGEVPMTEMVQAYSAFANTGIPKKINPFLKIIDKNGKVIYDITTNNNVILNINEPLSYPNFGLIDGKRAISAETAYAISHILSDNAARTPAFGSRSELVINGKTVSVKTGTTNDYRDNWTIGYTPNFLTAVWVGNNNFQPMLGVVSGITGAAPIWNNIMTELLKNQPDLPLIKPDGIAMTKVCKYNGQPYTRDDCPTYNELIIKGKNGPANTVYNKKVLINKDTNQPAKEGDTNVEEQDRTFIKDAFSESCTNCSGGTPVVIKGY